MNAKTTMAPPLLLVTGKGGVLDGERRELEHGATLVIGRSRSCDLSLRRCRRFVASSHQKALLDSEGFRRVSRVHCEIDYLRDGRVEIRDLSANGTLLDGRRMERPRVLVPGDDAVRLVLADPVHGTLSVRFEPAAD